MWTGGFEGLTGGFEGSTEPLNEMAQRAYGIEGGPSWGNATWVADLWGPGDTTCI